MAAEARLAIDNADPPSVLVLTSKSASEEDMTPNGSLRLFTRSGKEVWSKPIAHGMSMSSSNTMAVDWKRNRIYVHEFWISPESKGRTSALDLTGQRLWSVECEGPLVLDPKTGNLWVSSGPMLNYGAIDVFDPDGNGVAAWPIRAMAMSYDAHSDSMWAVGYEVVKMTRDGKVLYRNKIDGWCCSGVVVDANGTVRVAERGHPDNANSQDQISVLTNDGKLVQRTALKHSPANLVLDSGSGKYWAGGFGGLSRIDPDGNVDQPITTPIVDVSAGRDGVWVIDKSGLQRLDQNGRPVLTVELEPEIDSFNVYAIE